LEASLFAVLILGTANPQIAGDSKSYQVHSSFISVF